MEHISKINRCWGAALVVHSITGENKYLLFFEVVWSWYRWGASDEDYVRFEFYRKNSREKRRWLTSRLNNHYLVKRVLDKNAIDIFDNKELFDKQFVSFLKHDILIIQEHTEEEIKEFIEKYKTVIVKPSNGALGGGIYKLNFNDFDGLNNLLDSFRRGDRLILEEVIVEHPDMQRLNPTSVNTIRVITMIDAQGIVHILNTVAMIGADKGCVSNTHSGGCLCHIDTETGIIDRIGSNVQGQPILKHPVSGIVLPGYQIPNWTGLKEYVTQLALVVPTGRYIGWDIVILENGYDVIEGNIHPGQGNQATDGVGRWKIIKSMI